MNTEKIVFEQDNKQVIQEGKHFFTRIIENGESLESGDFNTLERAKSNLDIMPTVKESNQLIAEFMGLELEKTLSNKLVYARYEFNNTNKENDCQTNFYEANELLYHSDWNWLIEVVEKIASLPYHELKGLKEQIDLMTLKLPKSIFSKKEAVYMACVEFIKSNIRF